MKFVVENSVLVIALTIILAIIFSLFTHGGGMVFGLMGIEHGLGHMWH